MEKMVFCPEMTSMAKEMRLLQQKIVEHIKTCAKCRQSFKGAIPMIQTAFATATPENIENALDI